MLPWHAHPELLTTTVLQPLITGARHREHEVANRTKLQGGTFEGPMLSTKMSVRFTVTSYEVTLN